MAIVADFDSYPQWNDEVKAVYALARYDAGRPGPTSDQRSGAQRSRAKTSPLNLRRRAILPTKEVRIKPGTVQLQI